MTDDLDGFTRYVPNTVAAKRKGLLGVTINKQGQLRFTVAAFCAMGMPEYVEVLVHESGKQLAFRGVSPDEAGEPGVRKMSMANTVRSVTLKSVLADLGITHVVNQRLPSRMVGETLVADINTLFVSSESMRFLQGTA